jgi:hypothetical protein
MLEIAVIFRVSAKIMKKYLLEFIFRVPEYLCNILDSLCFPLCCQRYKIRAQKELHSDFNVVSTIYGEVNVYIFPSLLILRETFS